MNVPKSIEIALAGMIRGAELGSDTVVRAWQAMQLDGSWDRNKDREFPMVDVRFSPERVDANQATLVCDGSILCATLAVDDKSHAAVSAMYEAVHGVLRGIFLSFINGTGADYATFTAAVEAADPGAINIGGVTFSEPTPPYDDGGANMIGIGFAVHFSYK